MLVLVLPVLRCTTRCNFGPSIASHFPNSTRRLFSRLFIRCCMLFFFFLFLFFLFCHLILLLCSSSILFRFLFHFSVRLCRAQLLNYFCSKDYIWLLYFCARKGAQIKDGLPSRCHRYNCLNTSIFAFVSHSVRLVMLYILHSTSIQMQCTARHCTALQCNEEERKN